MDDGFHSLSDIYRCFDVDTHFQFTAVKLFLKLQKTVGPYLSNEPSYDELPFL